MYRERVHYENTQRTLKQVGAGNGESDLGKTIEGLKGVGPEGRSKPGAKFRLDGNSFDGWRLE